jgi:hypothetical protein
MRKNVPLSTAAEQGVMPFNNNILFPYYGYGYFSIIHYPRKIVMAKSTHVVPNKDKGGWDIKQSGGSICMG